MQAPRVPLGPVEIFTRTFALWWQNFGALAKTTVIVAIPMAIFTFAVMALAFPPELFVINSEPSLNPLAAYANVDWVLLGLGYLLLLLVGAALNVLMLGGLLQQLGSLVVGRTIGTATAFRIAWGKAGLFIATYIILAVVLLIATIPLYIPFIWLAVAWVAAFPVLAFEGIGGLDALKRSHHLVTGRWWVTFGALILILLAASVAGLVLYIPYVVVLFVASDMPVLVVGMAAAIGLVATVVGYPLYASAMTTIYLDLRLRKEGVVPTAEGESGFGWEQIYAVPERT